MHWADWAIIAGYILAVTFIGLLFIRRASGSVAEYFVAGRNLPWWLAGTSLVATSFAADTPLFVAGLIATRGIAGNWVWWNQVMIWALAVVFFARLWRRAQVITDAEFIELRYAGRVAAFLRGFKALYTSVIFSTCTVAWVMLAMQKIVSVTIAEPAWVRSLQGGLERTLGIEPGVIDLWKWIVLIGLFLVATLYTALSGFWGIVVTDLFQFLVALVGSVVFALLALNSVGGMESLRERLLTEYGTERFDNIFSFMPAVDSPWMPVSAFLVYITMVWWGDCGGFVAQRLFSTRTERDSVLASIWYSVAHFALRPWPWIVVGLVAMLYYPGAEDPESGYPRLIMQILPVGVRGLLVASLLAAFMSTVDTHLNWNASYFVSDVYKRFLAPDADERRCVRMSRISVGVFALLAIVVAYNMTSIESAVLTLFNLQAGIGLVLILRWFWWRINAWSELSSMIASLLITTALPVISDRYGLGWTPSTRIAITVALVTPVWVTVTLLTSPVRAEHLDAFYRRVRPVSAFWGPVAGRCRDVRADLDLGRTMIGWLAGATALFSVLFAIGKLVVGEPKSAAMACAVCIGAAVVLWVTFRARPNPMFGR